MSVLAEKPGITEFVTRLLDDARVQAQWRQDPMSLLSDYALTEEERDALLQGDADSVVGANERLTRRLKVDW